MNDVLDEEELVDDEVELLDEDDDLDAEPVGPLPGGPGRSCPVSTTLGATSSTGPSAPA